MRSVILTTCCYTRHHRNEEEREFTLPIWVTKPGFKQYVMIVGRIGIKSKKRYKGSSTHCGKISAACKSDIFCLERKKLVLFLSFFAWWDHWTIHVIGLVVSQNNLLQKPAMLRCPKSWNKTSENRCLTSSASFDVFEELTLSKNLPL